MTSRTENGSQIARRTDVWRSNNTCMICQDSCPTRADKDAHERQAKHKKKLQIYDFFAKEVPKFQPFSGPSVLVKRYTGCGELYVGLECLHELHFSFSPMPWWACSICYESGALMEQADIHLSSMGHITTYLDEFHSTKASTLKTDGDPLKVFEEIKRLCSEIFEEQGGEHIPPECLVMDASITKSDAMTRLAVDANRMKPSYRLHIDGCASLSQPRKILQCLICRQLVPCNDALLNRIWETHELSPGHRQAVAVVALLEQFGVTYEESGPDPKPIEGPLEWKVVDDVCYGPTCGMEYMVAFKNRSFCELCGCAVASVEKHFSCESHVMQFLSVSFPLEMFRLSHNAPKTRKKNVLDLLSSPKFRFGGGLHKRVNVDWFPPSVETVVKPECLSFPNLMPELSSLGIDCCCLFCPVCWLTVKVPKNVTDGGEALWNAHCGEHSHFDFAVRRACFSFDEKNFVPMSSTVPKAPKKLHGSWIQMKEDKDVFFIQTQGDVGLEFVVDDQENQEVVCTLCAQWFPRGMDTLINNHIRSYSHLNHYLHVTNRNLLSMLMVQKTEAATRELMLEWLQRSLYNDMDEMRLYSPELANRMRSWGNIAIRKVDATAYDSTHRPIFECVMELVDAVSKDGAEGAQISIKEALAVAAVKVHAMKERSGKVERILCRCTQCEMAFSTTIPEIVSTIWDHHLSSSQHFRRFRAFVANKLDMLGFSEGTSSYTVKPYKQQDPARKVTWQWNAKAKTHEFVLSVVGLEDLVERRSNEATGAHPPDFFCRLCAVEIPRRSACLESHVHSAQHVLCYVHKYYPQTIMELDMLPKEGGKEMRRVIAQLLKDHQPKEPYCIPIYDPIGEQERKGIVAMEKIKEEERQRHMAEARKRAQEQRKKKDEERRKQREKELEEEKARMAERARKEREARERAERLEQEKAHVKKLLQEAQRKAEEERKAKEAKERAKEAKERAEAEAEKQRRQEHLRSLLDREKQRLKALHEKEAQQRRLLEEKEELERKMRDLKDRAAFQRNGPAPVPAPDPRNMGPPDPRNMVPPDRRPMGPPDQRTMNPSVGLVNPPPPEPFRPPLLGTAPNIHNQPVPPPSSVYNVAPTGFRITFENAGAKPLFPSFVPIPEVTPVYKGMEEADRATRPMQPNIPVIDRPSLRERRVDPYISNPKIIQSRDQLVDFIWRQGAERIPEKELPVKFNEKAAGIEGALGVDCLYEVICADCSDLDTFYCSMCGFWTTPNDMFKHLETAEHKLAYLFRNYKMYHQTVVSETNSLVRSAMLSQFAIQIWKMEQPPGRVSNRLRSLLDRAIIERVWPEHVNVLDHSWKDEGKTVGRVEVPPPISKKDLGLVDDEPNHKQKKDKGAVKVEPSDGSSPASKRKESDRNGDRSSHSKRRSRSPEKKKSRRSRSRSRDKDKRKDESSRRPSTPEKKSSSKIKQESRKSASPERKRRRTRSPEKRSGRRDSRDRSSSRSRHRSRSRTRKRSSRSRSRSRSKTDHGSGSRKRSRSRSRGRRHGAGLGMSWEETAAAFLAKLGDSKAAASVLDAPKGDRSPSAQVRELEEKLEQLKNLAKNQSPNLDALLESTSNQRRLQEKLARREKAPPSPSPADFDEKAQMRKLLGVLITMQQEAERCGSLDESLIDKLYREVGLKKSVESSSDHLLAQLCSQISQGSGTRNKPSIDLQSFGISSRPEELKQQPSAGSSVFGGGQNRTSAFQTLLSEVKRSLDSLNSPRPASPLIKPPYGITNRDDVFPEGETISYVFPGTDCMQNSSRSAQSTTTTPPTSSSDANLSKKERAALRRKQLLEEAERLRKEAEAEDDGEDDGDDDDWDCLAEVINAPAPSTQNSGSNAHDKPQVQKYDFTKDVRQPNMKKDEKKDTVPLAPGQKMPLARTILPDGKSTYDVKAREKEREKGREREERSRDREREKEREKDRDKEREREREKDREKERERQREKEREKDKKKGSSSDKKAPSTKPHGNPSTWPQPFPQPLMNMQLDSPGAHQQPQSFAPPPQQNFQTPPQVNLPRNDPVYPTPVNTYPSQYQIYANQPPQQQQFPNQPFFPGQQFPPPQQPFVPGYDMQQMPPQQPYYGQPPYF